MTEQPSLNIEALARLDLRPNEILAITIGGLDATHANMAQISEDITEWLAAHGQPVAGVMVLPQGSGVAAIRAPEEGAASGTLPSVWGGLNRAEIREALEAAAAIKHLRAGYGG